MKLHGYLTYEQEPKPFSRTGIDYLKNGFFEFDGKKIPVSYVSRSVNNFGAVRLDFWIFHNYQYWHGVNIGDQQCATVTALKAKPRNLLPIPTRFDQ